MTTGLTGRQIRDKTIDGDDLKDSITVNPSGSAGGGFYVRGTGGYLLSASAGAGSVALSGSVSLDGGLTVAGSLSVTGGISGSLTRLPDGSAYLRAGSGISVVSGSDGSVTVSSTGSMPDLSYILLNNAGPVFENERILTAGTGITITDAGPKGSVTISAAGPAPGGWTTAYEVDFAALSSTGAKLGDGSQTINGKPWYVQNSSNASELEVINGTGLSIRSTAGGIGVAWGSYYRTAPLITAKLSDLTGGVQWIDASAFRVSAVVSWDFSSVYHQVLLGLENYLAEWGASMVSLYRTGDPRYYVGWVNSTTSDAGFAPTGYPSDDVFEIETACLYPWLARANTYVTTGGGFPASPNRHYRGSINTVAGPVSVTATPSGIYNQTAMAVTFAAPNAIGGPGAQAVLKRLRVEYR